MAKHTPGPWRHKSVGKRLLIYGARGVWLATAEYAAAHDVEPGDVDHAQAKANARLIAAAPEMLEALHKAFMALCELVPLNPAYEAEVVMLKEVITEAQGEWP